MDLVQQVTAKFEQVRMMRQEQALVLREFIHEHDVENVLEIGFYHGKSSTYIAAMLEERGRGHLTTIDRTNARDRSPNIEIMLSAMNLRHRVTPLYTKRSYTWELQRLISKPDRPKFDLCYFDGGHTWDVTGFGFVLVDMLLKPGGWIIFDDMDWTLQSLKDRTELLAQYDDDEANAPGVRLVWDLIAPHLGYENRYEVKKVRWGIAQKPAH